MKFDMPDPNCSFHYFSDIPLFDSLHICIYNIKEKIPEGESDLKNRTVIFIAYLGSAYIIPFSKHGIV